MCSIENLQAKVLSRVVVVFTRPNVFMYKPFCKVIQLTKTYSHFKNIRGVFANEIVAFFQILLVYMLDVLLGDDLIIIKTIKYLGRASILCRLRNVLRVSIRFSRI